MILPILAYGHKMLREPCQNIGKSFPDLDRLTSDMWDTMENAKGCGLAAPQIGKPIRLFVVDSKTTYDNLDEEARKDYFDKHDTGIRESFINAEIIERSADYWDDEEGCLSIPGLSQEVSRPWSIKIKYYNHNFEEITASFSGATARMIQHEYDHTEGILYLDYLKPLTRKLLASRLERVAKGKTRAGYPVKFVDK